jgi:hypothetical protein
VLPLLLAPQPSASRAPRPAARTDATEEEFAVYAAAIEKLFAGGEVTFDGHSKVTLLVIKYNTVADRFSPNILDNREYVKQELPSLSEVTVNDYREKNREPSQLKDSFNLKIKHVLVSQEEIEQAFKDGGWKGFYRKYPESGGYIGFSRVGFNPGMTQALVYFEHSCDLLCGSGLYVLLSKDSEGWKVINISRSWIS